MGRRNHALLLEVLVAILLVLAPIFKQSESRAGEDRTTYIDSAFHFAISHRQRLVAKIRDSGPLTAENTKLLREIDFMDEQATPLMGIAVFANAQELPLRHWIDRYNPNEYDQGTSANFGNLQGMVFRKNSMGIDAAVLYVAKGLRVFVISSRNYDSEFGIFASSFRDSGLGFSIDFLKAERALAYGPYLLPFYSNHSVTCGFGCYSGHTGVDYALSNQTSVGAADSGTIWNYAFTDEGGYGNMSVLKHSNGRRTRYAHLSSQLKTNGTSVSQGEEIAKSGNSGGPWCQEYNQQGECARWASPYHLHFETRINAGDTNYLAGTAVDPYASGDYLWTTNPPTLASQNTTVSLSANKIYSPLGKRVTLTWSSTSATSVVSSNFGASSVNGSVNVKPLTTTTYSITVNGPGGNASSQVTVNVAPLADFTRDGKSDLAAEYQSYGSWWVGVNMGGAFNSMNAWLYNQLIGTSVNILNGDYNGDGYMDVAARDISTGNWWVALNQGNNTFSTMQQVLSAQAGGTDYDIYGGDFNGDGLADFGVKYRPLGRWSISINQGSLSFTSFWTWLDGQLGGNDSDTFSGDFNYDGYTDIGGRYRPSGGWWIATNQLNSSFGSMTQWLTNQGGGNDWDTLAADFTGDGFTDIGGRYRPNGDWWIGTNTQGSAFNSLNTWLTGQAGGTGWDTFYGYFNNDAYADIGGRYGAYGDWWIGLNTGSQFGGMTKWLAGNAAGAGWNIINSRSE